MTTELEQEFFKVFGIEQKCKNAKFDNNDQKCEECIANYIIGCSCDEKYYPKITDRKLLEMICIYNSTYTNGYANYSLLNERNVEKLKEQILKNCLIVRDDIKHQIQQLFKEGE